MSEKYFYLTIVVIIFTACLPLGEIHTLQEGKTPDEDAEAIVQVDDDDNSAELNVRKGKTTDSEAGIKQSKIKKPVTEKKTPRAREFKRGELRRLLDEERFPARPRVHDSRHLHEHNERIDFEDQIGAGQWANRWFYETTSSFYRNVTIELLTSNEFEVRNWVTACPGHHYIKFKVKTSSDVIVYLSEHFQNIHQIRIKQCYVKINIGASTSYIASNSEDIDMNYAFHVHPKGKRYISADEYRAFWIWWDDNGLILVGKEHKNPFLAYYLNKYQGKRWKVKAVGFGGKEGGKRNFATWHINLEFPIHDDPAYEDHSDELSDQDIFV